MRKLRWSEALLWDVIFGVVMLLVDGWVECHKDAACCAMPAGPAHLRADTSDPTDPSHFFAL